MCRPKVGLLFLVLGLTGILLPAAEPGFLSLSIEPRPVDPIRMERPFEVYVFPEVEAVTGVRPKNIIRFRPGCEWKSAVLESRQNLTTGAWQEIARTNLVYHYLGEGIEIVDTRVVDPVSTFYRMRVETLPLMHPLASGSSPETIFESDIALDEHFAYYGNAHGELFRVSKSGQAPAQKIASVNLSRTLRLLLDSTEVDLPGEFKEASNTSISLNNLAVFGVAVDATNIYFTVNKILPIPITFTDEQIFIIGLYDPALAKLLKSLSDAGLIIYVVVPHTGTLLYLPKIAAEVAALTGQPAVPIVLAAGMNTAAGISMDETHLYWSCLGSHVDEIDLSNRAITIASKALAAVIESGDPNAAIPVIEEESGPIIVDAVLGAVTLLIYGVPPFAKNGTIERMAKVTAAPELLSPYLEDPEAIELKHIQQFIQPENLCSNLALPSRRIILKDDYVYFGETGGFPILTLGPLAGSSGISRVSKNGGEIQRISGKNANPAFLLDIADGQIFYGGSIPIMGGLGGLILKGFAFCGGVYRSPLAGGPETTLAMPFDYTATSTIKVHGDHLFFNNTFLLVPLGPEGSIRQMGLKDEFPLLPRVLRDVVPRASTLAMEGCVVYVTSSQKGTNSIVRVVR